jgi:hypothetical protein
MTFKLIKFKEIPNYLRDSLLYQSFIDNHTEQNDEVFVPSNFKNDLRISNYSDFVQVLEVCSFFMLCEQVPKEVERYININKSFLRGKLNEIRRKFSNLQMVIEMIEY